MRTLRSLLLALLLASPTLAAFAFKRSITVDRTKVPNTDQTNYPLMFCANGAASTNCDSTLGTLSAPDLKVTGSGGQVTNSNGYDIVFTSDGACASLLDWEVEIYTGSTGLIIAWVRIPTLTTGSDFVFYLCYGDATISTFQGNVTGTWNSNFKGVYHLGNGTSLSVADSTSNARNGTTSGTAPTAIAGQTDGAMDTYNHGSGSDQRYYTISDTGLPAGSSSRTISFWYLNPILTPAWSDAYLWWYGTLAANQALGLRLAALGLQIGVYDGSLHLLSTVLTAGVYYYIAFTFNNSGMVATVYVNASSIGTFTNASENTTLNGTMFIGEADPGIDNRASSANMDEFRISDVLRSTDWITTEYNNQASPSTFYAIGAASSGGGANRLLLMGVG